MSSLGYHVRTRLVDGRIITTSAEQRRLVARVVLNHGRQYNLLATSLADSHLHSECICDRRQAGQFAHGVEASLKQRLKLPVSFVQYEPEPIRSARHLRNGFKYILTQHERHALPLSAVFDSSNAPDLLGMRTLGRYTLDNMRRWLPRMDRSDILRWLDLRDLRPADGPLEHICSATLAATGLSNLNGQGRAVTSARIAMIAVLGDQLPPARAATLLAMTPRTLRRLGTRPADPRLVEAIRLQLGHRALCPPESANLHFSIDEQRRPG